MPVTDIPGDTDGPVGILLNPGSGRVRKHLDKIRSLIVALSPDAMYEARDLAGINTAIDELQKKGIGLLIIIGGDGTVQAALDRLFNRIGVPLPRILIIPGGTTNMTARDIGINTSPLRALRRLNRFRLEKRSPCRVERPVLRIAQAGQPVHHGLFFGAGIIASGARYFQDHIRKTGITGEFASFIVIVNFLLRLVRGQYRNELGQVKLDLAENNGFPQKVAPLLLFASTLDRLLLGLNPYWGVSAAPVHFTCIREGASRFWRSILAIVFRRGSRLNPADGYYSQNTRQVELLMDGDFLIDGELFNADSRNGPLQISATAPVTFLVL